MTTRCPVCNAKLRRKRYCCTPEPAKKPASTVLIRLVCHNELTFKHGPSVR